MRRIGKLLGGLILAGTTAAGLPALVAAEIQPRGNGPAYELIGKVAVMHEGRVKPLDTVAREEVKQVYSRETIKLHDPREEVEKILDPAAPPGKGRSERPVESWGHVSAFIGWTILPEYWDDQPFILVDHLPLRRRLMAATIKTRLEAIAGKSTTPEQEKVRLQKLAGDPEATSAELAAFVRGSKLPVDDRTTIAELAAKLSEEHKWLTPRELEEARITDKDQVVSFLDWASELQTQQRQFEANPQSAPRPLPIEKRAVEVAMRLWTYKAYSGERLQAPGLILIMPRPSNAQYLADSARTMKEAREKGNPRDLPVLKLDELKAISTYWEFVPRDDRHDPTENAVFDERYTAWLRDNSVWVPLKAILQSKPEELTAAGYPASQLQAFLDAYHELSKPNRDRRGRCLRRSQSGF